MESNNLGKGTSSRQISIGEEVNLDKINNIYLSIINLFEEIVKKSKNAHDQNLLSQLKTNKKIEFPVNKHMEMYILNNIENKSKIIKYLLFRYKFHLAGEKKINFGYPPYLLIEPVSSCNLKCPFCFQTDKSFTRKPYMGVIDLDFFKNIVDQADKLGTGAVTLASRGEPTMHKNFVEMLDYIGEKKNIFEVKTNTNGTRLNEKICHAIFRNKINLIVISSDHYIKKDYERLRLGSNFEKVVENVDRLFNIRKEFYPDSKTEIRISGIDNERNLDREKFKQFWIKRADHVSAGYPLERWDTYANEVHNDINDPCEFLWDRMYVWFDGKVNPCDADYKSYLSFGNAKEYSIEDLWNNKHVDKIRNDHLNNNRCKINPCDRCGTTFL